MKKPVRIKIILSVITALLLTLFVVFLCLPTNTIGTYSEVYKSNSEVDTKAIIDIKNGNTAILTFKEKEGIGYNKIKKTYEYAYIVESGKAHLHKVDDSSDVVDEVLNVGKFTITISKDTAETKYDNDLTLTNYLTVSLFVSQIIILVAMVPINVWIWIPVKNKGKDGD